jgi:hypothetical protein
MLPSQEAAERAAELRDRRPPMRPLGVGGGSDPCNICQRRAGSARSGLCPPCEKLYGGADWCGDVKKPVVQAKPEPAPPAGEAPAPKRERKPRAPKVAAPAGPAAGAESQPQARSRARVARPLTKSGSRSVAADAPPESDAPTEPLPDQVCSVAAAVLVPVAAETGRGPARFGPQLPLFGEEFWVEAINGVPRNREQEAAPC